MKNYQKVILPKRKEDKNFWGLFNGRQAAAAICVFLILWWGLGIFKMDDLYRLLLAIGGFALCLGMFLDMPNGLSVIQHIRLVYKYYLRSSKEFFYQPENRTLKQFMQLKETEDINDKKKTRKHKKGRG